MMLSQDFITPHITDSHALDYPCLKTGFICELELPRDLLHRERVPLRDAEPPRPRLETFPSACSGAGLEADHDPDASGRNPEREELRRGLAMPHAQPSRALAEIEQQTPAWGLRVGTHQP